MFFKTIVLFSCLCAVLAYPMDDYSPLEEYSEYEEPFVSEFELSRMKRQFNLQGGGSPGQGYDVNANARFPVWESQNGRNSLHGTAGYSQHIGGPYGNSRPDFRGGIQFTHRF